jgi:hypothetical protein
MRPSHLRVAHAHLLKLAKAESINRYIEKEWLPTIGEEIVRRVGGSFKVDFKRGYVLMVTTGRSDTVEVIGLRVSLSYRSGQTTMFLYHVLRGDSEEVNSLEGGTFFRLPPRDIAEWVVDQISGRAQTDLPFTDAERDKRNMERARAIVRAESPDLPWKQKKQRIQEVFLELKAGTRR